MFLLDTVFTSKIPSACVGTFTKGSSYGGTNWDRLTSVFEFILFVVLSEIGTIVCSAPEPVWVAFGIRFNVVDYGEEFICIVGQDKGLL